MPVPLVLVREYQNVEGHGQQCKVRHEIEDRYSEAVLGQRLRWQPERVGRASNTPCLRVYHIDRIDQITFIVPDLAMESKDQQGWFFVSNFLNSARGEEQQPEQNPEEQD